MIAGPSSVAASSISRRPRHRRWASLALLMWRSTWSAKADLNRLIAKAKHGDGRRKPPVFLFGSQEDPARGRSAAAPTQQDYSAGCLGFGLTKVLLRLLQSSILAPLRCMITLCWITESVLFQAQ